MLAVLNPAAGFTSHVVTTVKSHCATVHWSKLVSLLQHRTWCFCFHTHRQALHLPLAATALQVVNVLGFKLPFYKSATLLLSLGLSVRVLYYLFKQRPQVIHVSTPGIMCFAAVLYARLLAVPLVMSYHTHIPEYIPRYTWSGLVQPMWSIIRWCTRRADLTLVTSKAMKVSWLSVLHNFMQARVEVLHSGGQLQHLRAHKPGR